MPTRPVLADRSSVLPRNQTLLDALDSREKAARNQQPAAEPPRRRRGGLGFVDERQHSRPLDRNDRAKLLFLAESLERRSKAKSNKNGALGYTGLRVLRALLLLFQNAKSGLCCPSYTALQCATGLCRQAIADALFRLEATKLLTITRRLVRERITRPCPYTGRPIAHVQAVQGSNLYAFNLPGKDELVPLPFRTSRSRTRPFGTRPESASQRENIPHHQPGREIAPSLGRHLAAAMGSAMNSARG